MIFQNEKKKELWRYASKNNPVACDGIPNQPPPLHHHPHRTLPQFIQHQQEQTLQRTIYACSCNAVNYSSSNEFNHVPSITALTAHQCQNQQLNTPPPPYTPVAVTLGTIKNRSTSSVSSQKKSDSPYSFGQQTQFAMGANKTSISITEESDNGCELLEEYTKGGCKLGTICENMLIGEQQQFKNCYGNLMYLCEPDSSEKIPSVNPTVPIVQPSSNFAMSAINVFRNCCGKNLFTNSNSITSIPTSVMTNMVASNEMNPSSFPTTYHLLGKRTLNQEFNGLLKQFKSKQLAEFHRAVKSRLEPQSTVSISNFSSTNLSHYSQCILIKRFATSCEEEQYVTACRLFFWPDLKNASELKRLPICLSEFDPVYICCNPLHWCRILETELAPPPYRSSNMPRLITTESLSQIGNADVRRELQSKNGTSSNRQQFDKHILESLSTGGRDCNKSSMIWCQIAYWELAQRVGAFYQATNPVVNIYLESFRGNGSRGDDDMCLKNLVDHSSTTSVVHHTRQKIGLGITLSLDSDCVWIYNRASVPIFVASPTITECLDRVCKVLPGYCLMAFDMLRAQTFNSRYFHDKHFGPIDQFSIKISFAKGWGNTYKRQNIMGCPCWLEVHFPQQR